MDRPLLEVADVIRAAGDSFADRHRAWLRWPHIKTLNAIQRCRTAALGGHIDECSGCGHRAISYNSCLMGSISFWGVRPRNQRCSKFEWTLRLPITNRALLLRWCVPPPFKS